MNHHHSVSVDLISGLLTDNLSRSIKSLLFHAVCCTHVNLVDEWNQQCFQTKTLNSKLATAWFSLLVCADGQSHSIVMRLSFNSSRYGCKKALLLFQCFHPHLDLVVGGGGGCQGVCSIVPGPNASGGRGVGWAGVHWICGCKGDRSFSCWCRLWWCRCLSKHCTYAQ